MKRTVRTAVWAIALFSAPAFCGAATFSYDVTGSSLSEGTPAAATFTLDSLAAAAGSDDSIDFSDVLVTTGTSQRDVDLTFLGSNNTRFGSGFEIYENGAIVGGGTGSSPLFTGSEFDPVLSTGKFTFAAYDGPGTITADVSQVSAAPEPGAWALMIIGLGLAGMMLRSRHRPVLVTGSAWPSDRAEWVS